MYNYKDLLVYRILKNRLTCWFALDRVSDLNKSFRVNSGAASVGFIYRHIGELMNILGFFFWVLFWDSFLGFLPIFRIPTRGKWIRVRGQISLYAEIFWKGGWDAVWFGGFYQGGGMAFFSRYAYFLDRLVEYAYFLLFFFLRPITWVHSLTYARGGELPLSGGWVILE